jgi:hypothetical protein
MWHKRLFGLMLFVIMVMSLAVNVDAPARAQGPDDDEEDDVLVEIEGVLEEVGDDLMIDGTVVAPAGAFNPSRYMGECLAVTGRVLNDDTLQVVSAEPCEDDGEDEDDDEDEDENEDDGEDEDGGCGREGHPVLTAYSEEFDVPYEDLAEYHCDGNGMGEIGRALLLADATGLSYEEILAMREDMGWGQIKKELMEEYDLSPRDLAPGRVISGRHDGEDDEESGQRTPPGQGKDKGNKGQGRGRK